MITAQAHTPARTAPITPAQTKWEAFATRQPDRALWINVNRDRDSFAASLHSAVLRYGDLTERQGAAVDRNIERHRAGVSDRQAREASAPTVEQANVAGLQAAFDRAAASGLRYPKMRFPEFTASRAGDESRNPGAIYCKERSAGAYLGMIKAGRFVRSRECSDDQQAEILRTMLDPLGEAVRFGRLFGGCSICGRGLKDPVSVERGIGPICAERFGL